MFGDSISQLFNMQIVIADGARDMNRLHEKQVHEFLT